MRNVILFALIFLPVVGLVLYLYSVIFKKVAGPVAPPDLPPRYVRCAELTRLREELRDKMTLLSDIREINALQKRVDAINKQLDDLASPNASSSPT